MAYARRLSQPKTGLYRIACTQPCSIDDGESLRRGVIWNVSTGGAYLVADPVPPLGAWVCVTFFLAGEPGALSAPAVVAWRNLPSLWAGCGDTVACLPPGCGVRFVSLSASDRTRIEAHVRMTYPVGEAAVRNPRPARPRPLGPPARSA